MSRVSAKVDRELTDEDFKFRQKFTFDKYYIRETRLICSQGNELSPASRHDFKFKDYAPWVFRHLRALFHLDPADYLISLTSHILLSELYCLPVLGLMIVAPPVKAEVSFTFHETIDSSLKPFITQNISTLERSFDSTLNTLKRIQIHSYLNSMAYIESR